MHNTIMLLHGHAHLSTKTELPRFDQGDTIWGIDESPKEIRRWPIEEKALALAELAKHHCSYNSGREITEIEEWALAYCECDEDGETIGGSDYDIAQDDPEHSFSAIRSR